MGIAARQDAQPDDGAPSARSARGILDVALRDRRIASNPARGVKLPRKVSKSRAYLTHQQVADLARESSHPELVVLLAYTGLRWGEATGLRVKHVDLRRRRVSVEENAVEVGSAIQVGTPKTHEKRLVPYPPFLADTMERLVAGREHEELVFGDGKMHVRRPKRMLGHASAVMTLDTYADLFDDDLDSVSEALGTAAASSNVAAILSAATPRDNDA